MYLRFALIVDRFACINPFVINVDWLCQIFILQMKLKINIIKRNFFGDSKTISAVIGCQDQHIQSYFSIKYLVLVLDTPTLTDNVPVSLTTEIAKESQEILYNRIFKLE